MPCTNRGPLGPRTHRTTTPLRLAVALAATFLVGPAASAQKAPAKGAAWTPLFDGTSLKGWHNYATPGQPVVGWTAEGGLLVRSGEGGDLTTDKQYANFELELEWKVEKGGNSGIIYRIDHRGEKTYISGP